MICSSVAAQLTIGRGELQFAFVERHYVMRNCLPEETRNCISDLPVFVLGAAEE